MRTEATVLTAKSGCLSCITSCLARGIKCDTPTGRWTDVGCWSSERGGRHFVLQGLVGNVRLDHIDLGAGKQVDMSAEWKGKWVETDGEERPPAAV